MNPKLAKRRDELAEEMFSEIKSAVVMRWEFTACWREGFDACYAEMLPMLEQMAEALRKIERPDHFEPDYQTRYYCAVDKASVALAAYQAWRDER